MLPAYIDTLSRKARRARIPLKDAFVAAGLNTSVYYRAMKGVDLRHDTARRVHDVIEARLHARRHPESASPDRVDDA